MKLIPSNSNFPTYSENNQNNPLRYQILFREGDELHVQTGVFKCKDFFNDLVAWYLGKKFMVYGMDTRTIKLNDEGVYILFTGQVRKEFETHLEEIINPKLKEDLGVVMSRVDTEECVYLIPREVFNHTKTIGWLMYFIRQCNYPKKRSLEEMLSSPGESSGTERRIAELYLSGIPTITTVLNPGGLLPIEPLRKFAWYYSGSYHSEAASDVYQIHNAGPIQWSDVETRYMAEGDIPQKEVANAL